MRGHNLGRSLQATGSGLAVIETHPIQYHAPVYRALEAHYGIPVTAIYGSDFSIVGYHDREFGTTFAWDTDLLSGYTSRFVSHVRTAGAPEASQIQMNGLGAHLRAAAPRAVLLVGTSPRFHQLAFLHASRLGCPILMRGETTDHARRRALAMSLARDLMLRAMYSRCSRLLYVGQRSYAHFKRLGCSEDKLVFSPYCVAADALACDEDARARQRAATRQKLGVEDAKTLLLFSGKLSPRKGPDLLVRAVGVLPSPLREDVVVVFLGDGQLRGALQAGSEVVASARIHVLGFQNQTQLSAYYHAADLLVVPSRRLETWGLVVNEGLLHGLPAVVSSAVGCAPDLVVPGVTGEVFATESIDDLASTLERSRRLMRRPDVRAACRARVAAYSVDRAAEGIASAYHQVVVGA